MSNAEYNTIFHDYLLRGLAQMLARVQAAEPLPDERDREQAWHLLSYAFKHAAAWPATRALLLALAPKMEQAGFREEWLLYLLEGHRQAQVQGDRLTSAECELQIGLLYRLQSKFDLARQQLTASVAGFAGLHAAHDEARALNELAWLDHLQHRYAEATQHVEKALALLNDEDPECAMCYRVLGMIAIDQERWQEAEEFHSKSLILFELRRDRRRIAWGIQNLAYALYGQKRFVEAISYYQQASVALAKLGDTNNWVIVQMNLGLAYLQFGEPQEAVQCLSKAIHINRGLPSPLQLAGIFTNLGLAYMALSNYTKAEASFHSAVNLYTQLEDQSLRLNAIDGLAMTYLANKQYDQAINLLEEAVAVLPQINAMPSYDYLLKSLNTHLIEAKRGQGLFQ